MIKKQEVADFDPERPFEGLGLRGWLRVIFRTRAQTLRQNDKMLDVLMNQNAQAMSQLNELQKAIKPLAHLARVQNEHLAAIDELADRFLSGMADPRETVRAIREESQRGLLEARAEV